MLLDFDELYLKRENEIKERSTIIRTNTLISVIFSKDRAMQLDATLKSFFLHCKDSRSVTLKIIYNTSSNIHELQYHQLMAEYLEVDFIKENSFKEDLLSLLEQYRHVLFMVDDNIFTRSFHVSDAVTQLDTNPDVLGFSLRLGKNNKYYYMMNCRQRLPEFQKLDSALLKYDWTVAEYDFGFPLEVSSSIYRISDLWSILFRIDFSSPNTLEFMLAKHKELYKSTSNHLICYEQSVVFCNPANIVNSVHINRAGNRYEYTSRSLADLFNQGFRVDVKSYADFVPSACHQEVDFVFCKTNSEPRGTLAETYPYSSFVKPERNSDNIMDIGNNTPTRKENIKKMENTENILTDGERMYKNGRYFEAEKIFREVIKNNIGCAQAYNNLSCVLWETGRHDEALQALTKSMKITPNNRDAIWNLGRILKFKDQDDDASQVYDSYLKRHPEDQDLFKALLWWEDKKNNIESVNIPDISVIIPAFNCEKTIIKTLESVKKSLEYCSSIIDMLNTEVIIVNDNSTDDIVSLLNGFIKSASHFYLISNSENLGAGPSRNKGVKHSKGDLIFFLDGDDLFLEDHIFQCVKVMIDQPDTHFVKTKIRIDETIHPYWRNAIENSVPINICVKKWCHYLIGGFPEEEAFKVLPCEDVVYNSNLAKYFIGQKIERQTVHHFRYPGNALDRQMEKFSKAPTPTAFMDALNDAERSVWPEIKMIMNKNQHALEQSLKSWSKHISLKIINGSE